jgi:hypothetical protein
MCLRSDPTSKTMFLVAQLGLLGSGLMYLPARLAPHFHPDLMDGVRGVFIGVAIAAFGVAAARNRRRPV